MSAHERKLRNFLINPTVQFRLGLISLSMIVLFALSLIVVAYFSVNDLFSTLAEQTDMQENVRQIIVGKIAEFASWLIVLLFIFSTLTMAIIILESHKIVGAAYAINKFINEKLMNKNFGEKVHLREGDFLQDLAQSINDFSSKMELEAHQVASEKSNIDS